MSRADEGLAFMLQFENVAWYQKGVVRILDRRVYPARKEFVICDSHTQVAEAIRDMVTQSAGPYTAAGMGMALAAYESRDMSEADQWEFLNRAADVLANARPTTYNRMNKIVLGCLEVAKDAMNLGQPVDEMIFQHTVESINRRYTTISKVAEHLVDMFPQNGRIMTQCFGETIVGMMLKEATKRQLDIKLYCPETRPYLQGARLTASVAREQGFETTIITDNMAAATMKRKKIDVFTSAADSIIMDGHVVNKVGTFQIAIVANYMNVPYFVTGIPDLEYQQVSQVRLEERDPREVLEFRGVRTTYPGVKGYYPAFDVTPPNLISGVVTDKGTYSPFDLARYFKGEVQKFY